MSTEVQNAIECAKRLRASLPDHWHDGAVTDFDDAMAAYDARPQYTGQCRAALVAIKDRIGDLDKLEGDGKAQARRWTLNAVWSIAHNTLIDADRSDTPATGEDVMATNPKIAPCPIGHSADKAIMKAEGNR